MKTLKAFLAIVFLLVATSAWATTNTASAGTTWSGATWSAGHVPLDGEDVVINTGVSLAIDVVRIPATSGDLASLTGTTTAALTCDMAARSYDIHVNNASGTKIIQGGTATGFITLSGTPGSNTFTLTGGTLTTAAAGYGVYVNSATPVGACTLNCDIRAAGTNSFGVRTGSAIAANISINGNVLGTTSGSTTTGVYNNGTGTVAISGDVSGGSTASALGVNNAQGDVTIGGNVTGGTGNLSYGYYSIGTGAPTCTLAATSRLINGTGGVAYAGKPPTWSPTATNYMNWGGLTWAPLPTVANVKSGVAVGNIIGTYGGSTFGVSP